MSLFGLSMKFKVACVSETEVVPEFKELYLSKIKPKEDSFEVNRKSAYKTYKSRSIATVLISFFLVFIAGKILDQFFYNQSPGDLTVFELMFMVFSTKGGVGDTVSDIVIGGSLLIFVGLGYWSWWPVKSYISKVKKDIFPIIFSFFGESFRYQEESRLDVRGLQRDSLIIPEYSYADKSDYVKGDVSGVDIQLSEVKLKRKKDKQSDKVVFEGIMVLLSMNKNFSGNTVIKRDRGAILNFLTGNIGNCERVKLEDIKFEKEFEVFSSDQVEARYLLTPSFMERLMYLSDLFGAKVEASFFNNRLLFLIHTNRDFFEISDVSKPVNFIQDANLIIEEMKTILQIIEILKLGKI